MSWWEVPKNAPKGGTNNVGKLPRCSDCVQELVVCKQKQLQTIIVARAGIDQSDPPVRGEMSQAQPPPLRVGGPAELVGNA